jgi:hypothetical protein
MNNIQKVNNCINIPLSRTSKSYEHTRSLKTMVNIYQATLRHIPEDSNLLYFILLSFLIYE